MHKKMLIAGVTVVVIGTGLLSSSSVRAFDPTSNQHPMSEMADRIATKFGLNKDEVQAVFDQAKQEHEAERKAKFEARLTQLVTDGKITDAQKQLIITKQAELEASRPSKLESLKDKTPAERKAMMESERQALQAWADQNEIDLHYLMLMGHGRGHDRPATPPAH